ncbi:hypothetical protein LCGC14_0997340 [marine sediment metagenome]|uniref:Uncharacterized protein n=1 Tax=marine sediment metagenome TaxID=412755 RepID=A0A0F9NQL7_9ZZZZ
MSKEKLTEIAGEYLADILEQSGTILYSSQETLKLGNVYLLGLNPVGVGSDPLIKSIDTMLT